MKTALCPVVLAALLAVAGCAIPTTPEQKKQAAVSQYVEGYQAFKSGDTSKAKENLEGAVAANPDLRMARTLLGEIYRSEKNYNAAAKQYEVLSEIDPYTLSNHYYLGVSYQFLTRYKESITAYLRGLKLDPNDFKSNMNIGTVYLALGDLDNAVNYIDRATQIDPESGVAWSNLGVALDARGSLVLAEAAYRKAVEREPQSIAMLQNLANNLLAQRKSGESVYLWQQIVEKNPGPFTRSKLGEAYTLGQEFDKAAAEFDGVLKTDPRYLPALNGKAALLLRQYELSGFTNESQRTDAVGLLKQSIALNPNQPRAADLLKKYENVSAIRP